MKELMQVRDLCKKNILNNITFSLCEGELIAIMGPSGSGKSTLLYNVSGMDQADSGSVWLKGIEIVGLAETEKAKLRLNKMGFVFQQMNVLSNLNIIDNILLPSVHVNKSKEFKRQQLEKAHMLMSKLHIDELAERKVTEVSGGQLQRACICRSMMLEPEILFADEPTGALNKTASEEIIQAFLQINAAGTSILMVTHDSKIAAKCERILYIIDGEIQGELELGKYKEGDAVRRERKTAQWLQAMGW